MPDWLHRTDVVLLTSVAEADLLEIATNYIEDPDLSNVGGVPSKYWDIVGDTVSEMSAGEKAVVDATDLSASRDDEMEALDRLESHVRSLALVVLDEINTLRGEHALPARTMAQLKAAMKSKLGG